MTVLPVAAMAFDRAAARSEPFHDQLQARPDRMRRRMAGAADVRPARTACRLAGKRGKIVGEA